MHKEEDEILTELQNTENTNDHAAESQTIQNIVGSLWRKRKTFYITIPIAFVVAVMLSLCIPKTYTVGVKLAPEMTSAAGISSSGLSGIMKSMGISRGATNTEADAIMPNLYPDLMNSQAFLVSLFDIPVISKNGKINTTYYNYLDKYQKTAWWNKVIGFFISLIPDFEREEPQTASIKTSTQSNKAKTLNASALNKRQTAIMKAIGKNVICDVDKKTFVISITVKAQDPVICTTVADSTCRRLQEFITEYRTKKARIEYNHMLEQYNTARQEYEEAKEKVAIYNDANWDLVEEDFVLEKQALQNEMQLRFSALSSINTQLLTCRAKLDEAKPVFTILDGASVPLKPTNPKKKPFVLSIVFLVTVLQSIWIVRKDLLQLALSTSSKPTRRRHPSRRRTAN